MLKNDRRRLELAHSLILTLPGSCVLRNGDEIGMGENLALNERDAIRTPMQWATAPNAGFSPAPADKLVLPVIGEGEFGYSKVNVAKQKRDPESFLSWNERMTRLRLRTPEFGTSQCEWLETDHPEVLAHRCCGGRSSVFAIHNFSGRELDVRIKLGRVSGLYDLLKNAECCGDGRFHLEPYGYLWLREGRGQESLAGGLD